MCWSNNIILSNQTKKLIILTKGEGSIDVGEINIKSVRRYKCPLQTVECEDFDYEAPMLDADPGKYIVYYE